MIGNKNLESGFKSNPPFFSLESESGFLLSSSESGFEFAHYWYVLCQIEKKNHIVTIPHGSRCDILDGQLFCHDILLHVRGPNLFFKYFYFPFGPGLLYPLRVPPKVQIIVHKRVLGGYELSKKVWPWKVTLSKSNELRPTFQEKSDIYIRRSVISICLVQDMG